VVKFPIGKVGTRFTYQMKLWGGVSPFSWTIASGRLPPGLRLDASTGLIRGIPSGSGTYQFSVRVVDSSLATQAGKPRTFVTRVMKLTVNA
jgi:large repetitive protein